MRITNDNAAVIPVYERPIPYSFDGHPRPDVGIGLSESIGMLHALSILLARDTGLDEVVLGSISNLLDGIVKTLEGVEAVVMERKPAEEANE